MNKLKLKVEEMQVESFETVVEEDVRGTVKGNMLLRTADEGTCRGQTGLCTGCTPVACY